MPDQVLSPDELEHNPELAALAILDQVLATAGCALRSAQPNLDDPERPYWIRRPLSEQVAARIVSLAATLSRFIHNYRAALLVERTRASAAETVPHPTRAEEF